MRLAALGSVFALALSSHVPEQHFEGIVVVGAAKRAAQSAQVILLGKRDTPVDSAVTDAFGGFKVAAPKPGKYTLLVRRKGFLPVQTEAFNLPEGEVLTDTVFLTGRSAELSVKDALVESTRRVFGAPAMVSMSRMIDPDSMAVLRQRYVTLGDVIRSGRLLALTLPNGSGSTCVRFSGERGCAQLFVDELPVYFRPDQLFLSDVEAIMAFRPIELGSAATESRQYFDNSRYGVVMIYTTRFSLR